MARTDDFSSDILFRFDGLHQYIRQAPINLGGSSGSGGGSGGPPGGFSGVLPQTRVAGDSTESFVPTSGSMRHLLDNLDFLRAYAKATHQFWASTGSPPVNSLAISSGSWHHTSGQEPLMFTGGNTPAVSAPSSGSRFDRLIINTSGVLGWTHGSEGNPPTLPTISTPTSGSLPLWTVLVRSSGSLIQRYDDGISHYIFKDDRPLFDWGIGGSSGSTLKVQDEGSDVVTSPTVLNFTGAGVSVTNPSPNVAQIDISGGGSGGMVSGEWMNVSSGSMHWRPTDVLTVGPNGRYATVQSAINAATTGQGTIIMVGPGFYPEDVTLKDGISLVGADTGAVRIRGLGTVDAFSGTGAVTLSSGSAMIDNVTIEQTYSSGASNGCIKVTGGQLIARRVEMYALSSSTHAVKITGGTAYLYDCVGRASNVSPVLCSGGQTIISSGSWSANSPTSEIVQQSSGAIALSGGRWRSTGGSINFLDVPRNYATVGPERCQYNNIAQALSDTSGFASESNPVTILVYPGTYTTDFTVGNYQEVLGVGERSTIIKASVTLNGTRSSIANCRINPDSGTGIVVSGGSPYIFNNAIVATSGSAVQVTSGTPTFKNNSFSATTGVLLSGGSVLFDGNFHNSGVTTIVNGATANLNDWMDTLQVNTGTVTLGANASADTFTFTGGTLTSRKKYSGYFSSTIGVGMTPATNVGAGITNSGIAVLAIVSDAGTNNTPSGLDFRHNTSSTAAAGFGLASTYRLDTDGAASRTGGIDYITWATVTDASRKARRRFTVYDTAEREALRLEASGTAAMIGMLGAVATARETVTGSRGGNAALADLLTKLATKGIITDGTSA